MTPPLWLLGTALATIGAYLVGWPAWQGYQTRDRRDANVDRYLAWRGRADRGAPRSLSEGMTGVERRRLWIAGALVVAALICLAAFFAAG